MNKFLIVALVACVSCRDTFAGNPYDAHAEITKYENHIDDVGNYNYKYETSNGISGEEKGVGGHWATGGYGYYSPEGELIQLVYLADENGFQPTGSHIPIAPPIPYAILKSLEYIRTHPSKDEQQ